VSPQNYPIFQYFSPPSIPAVDPLILPFSSWSMGISMDIFSGKHTNSYWKWLFIVDLPIENDDFDDFP
jgi:hypothetical protein